MNRLSDESWITRSVMIHADDIGLTRASTDRILECCDQGALNSVSLLPNAMAFDYAQTALAQRPYVRVCAHINLLEGCSLSPQSEVDRLVDANGKFYHSFVSLWKLYTRAGSSEKRLLQRQVRLEMKTQIQKVFSGDLHKRPVCVDSHNHYHMIPFVFNALLDLVDELGIRYIRIPQERFFMAGRSLRDVSVYTGSGLVKHLLLNHLSHGRKHTLKRLGVSYPDNFIGVLFTGQMTEYVMRTALRKSDSVTEVLFHPGGDVRTEDLDAWVQKPLFAEYYASPLRQFEYEQLQSSSVKMLLSDGEKYHV